MRLTNLQVLTVCAVALASSSSAAESRILADFNTPDSIKQIRHSFQSRVFDVALEETTNTLDSSPALRFSATMAGPDAGWSTLTFPVAETTPPLTLRHGVSFQASGFANTRTLQVTAVKADGERWSICEPLTADWQNLTVPFSKFTKQSGPPTTDTDVNPNMFTAPAPVQFLEVSMTNRFESANGIMLDNVKIVELNPEYRLATETTETLTVPLQKPYKLKLTALNPETGEKTTATSELSVQPDEALGVLCADRVQLRDGEATIDLFVRKPGLHTLRVEDPVLSQPLVIEFIGIVDGPHLDTHIGTENSVCYSMMQKFARYRVGADNLGGQPAESVHLTLRDWRGRVVGERNDALRGLSTGGARIQFPMPGLYEAEVLLIKEPNTALPQATDNLVNMFTAQHADPVIANEMSAAMPMSLADGVTTALCTGHLTVMETLPTTATIVARDRVPVVVFGPSALENTSQWNSPFGIAGTGLFALDQSKFQTEGDKRVTWHNRLGSRWVRDDFERTGIEPWRGAYDWERFDRSTLLYREAKLKVLGSLTSPALWANGEPPVTNEERDLWTEWVKTMASHAGSKVMAWEPWPESNTERAWGKYPDPFGYRELMRATWDGLRNAGNEYASNYQVVGGATVGTDTMFFDTILTSGFSKFLNIVSFRPMPLRDDRSPEDNSLTRVVQTMRKSMMRAGLIGNERNTEQWITALGWATGKNGATYMDQARWLTQSYTIAFANKVDKVFWSNLIDDEKQKRGLFTNNWQVKPAAIAYNFMQYQMSQTTAKESLQKGKAQLHVFDIQRHSMRWAGTMTIAWTDEPGAMETLEFTSKVGGFFVHDFLGAEQTPELLNSQPAPTEDKFPVRTYRVKVGNDPVYIWDVGQPPKIRGTAAIETQTTRPEAFQGDRNNVDETVTLGEEK